MQSSDVVRGAKDAITGAAGEAVTGMSSAAESAADGIREGQWCS